MHIIEIPASQQVWRLLEVTMSDNTNVALGHVDYNFGLFDSLEDAERYSKYDFLGNPKAPSLMTGVFGAQGSLIKNFQKKGGSFNYKFSTGLLKELLTHQAEDIAEDDVANIINLHTLARARNLMHGLEFKDKNTGEVLFVVSRMGEDENELG